MPWIPSKETQSLLRDVKIARLLAKAILERKTEITLPDGSVIKLEWVEPVTE